MAHKRTILTAIASAVTTADLVAAVPGCKICVVSLVITAGAGAGTLKFQSGGSTDITAVHHYAINGGLVVGQGDEARVMETAIGEKLNYVGTGGPFDITARYYLAQS